MTPVPSRQVQHSLKGRVVLCLAGLLVLLIASLPEIVGHTVHGDRFLGVPSGLDLLDTFHYVERAREGARGTLLATNLHSAEPDVIHPQLNLLPSVAGVLMGLAGIPALYYPWLAKLIFGSILLTVLAMLAGRVFTPSEHGPGLVMLWLGAGAFWVLDATSLLSEGPSMPSYIDRMTTLQPDNVTFFTFYYQGHLALALALILGCLWQIFLSSSPSRTRAPAMGFVLGFIHPYDVIPLAVVTMGQLLWMAARRQAGIGERFRVAVLTGVAAGLPLVFHYLSSYQGFRKLRVDDHWLGPVDYVYSFGLPLLFTLYFMISNIGPGREEHEADSTGFSLWVVWVLMVPFLLFYPGFYFRRKLALGLSVPLAILGAKGAVRFCRSVTGDRPMAARCLLGFFILCSCLTPLDVVARDTTLVLQGHHPPVMTEELRDLIRWVNSERDEDRGTVLVVPSHLSQLFPGVTGRRVYSGWIIFVKDPDGKARELKVFLDASTTTLEREKFLRRHHVDLLILSATDMERTGLQADPSLTLAARFGNLAVLDVAR